MQRLIDGYRRFRETTWPAERARYEQLATHGQRPETLIVSCSDSRVDPQTVFGAGPGELFVVRNVAGLVPPYQVDGHYHGTSSALEFGVRVLKVRNIVVLGHAQCGGVQAMIEGMPDEAQDFVAPWMQIAAPALKRIPHDVDRETGLRHGEMEVVRLSLENLMSFPWIAERVKQGDLQLGGFRFGVRTGVLEKLEGDAMVPIST